MVITEETELKLKRMYVRDLAKPELDKIERAKIIKDVMDRESLTQRGFAKRYGFKYSTVQDWLLYNRISDDQILAMRSEGMNDKGIYRTLRNYRDLNGTEICEMITRLDALIQDCIEGLKAANRREKPLKSKITKDLLDRLVKEANTLMFRLDRC